MRHAKPTVPKEPHPNENAAEHDSGLRRGLFRQLNPLDGFAIDGTRLRFQNLGSDAEETYRHQWFVFDNDTATTKPIADAEEGDTRSIAIPVSDAKYLMVRVRTVHDKEIEWRKAVDVFLRRTDSGFEVVGIDREL